MSTTNSGRAAGVPVDVVSVGTAASLTYDTTHSGYHGDRAVRVATGASVVNCYGAWTNMYRPGSGAAQVLTVWLYFTANPGATVSVALVANASVARICEMRVTGTGKIRILNGAGTSVLETSASIALNQWVRADLLFTPHASAGSLQVKLYNTPSSSTPTETTATLTGQNLRQAQVEGVYCGVTNGVTNVTYWMQAAITDGAALPATGGWVMSRWLGAVTESSVGVAARVLGASSVRLKVSTTSNLLTSPTYSSAQSPDSDGTVRMSVTGLSADTTYYYGIEVDSVVDTEYNGSFRTAPTPGTQASFSFTAASCAQNNTNATVFDAIRGDSPRFHVHLGDLHYRDIVTNDQVAFHKAYDQVMSGSRYARLLGEVPVPYIWSDHDSVGPNGDASSAATPAANAVYRSRVPSHALPATTGTYFAFTWGRIRCIFTDGRSFMDPIADVDDASKTKLGSTQKAWLIDELTDPAYPVKLWFHEDAISNGATFTGDDTWSAYSTERAEIFAEIADAGARVAYICGDLHMLAADDGTNVPTVGANSGVPVHVCSPLDNTSFGGNGTYTAGEYPTVDGTASNLYGLFTITDSGDEIELLFQGKDSGGTSRITQTVSWTVAEEHSGTGSISSTGTLSSAGVKAASGTAAMSSAGTLSSTGSKSTSAAVTISSTGSLTSAGVKGTPGTAALTSSGTLSSSGATARPGTASVTASAALTTSGTTQRSGIGQITSEATLTASGTSEEPGESHSGTGAITSTATLSSAGTATRTGTATLTTPTGLTATGTAARMGTALLSVAVTLTTSGVTARSGTATLTTAATLTSSGHQGDETNDITARIKTPTGRRWSARTGRR
ncbi:alkaline phosphatase D family protein [Planobispora rosea]|uniref:alkaline phosphatase D family protein n=1 Tax=Planobispora rosea TaxID=35762 RepID=UPI00114D2F0D|nr:alkaline phosphatase D family protein [Planobispora rosea]